MTSLNYSKQIIDFFKNDKTTQLIEQKEKTALKELLSLLDKSIKFILPERGEILTSYNAEEGEQNKFNREWVDLMFLPYPIVAFEIPFTYHDTEKVKQIDGINLQVQSEKRVALCWNPKHDDPDILKINKILEKYDFINSPNYLVGEKDSYDGFCIAVFFYNQIEKEWCYAPSGAFLPYSLNQNIDPSTKDDGALYGRLINLFPFYTDILYKQYNFRSSSLQKQLWLDINHEVWAILQVCCVLNCENIRTRTISPPDKQQKSRIRKGLKPLYSYKALTIKASGAGYENMYGVGTEQGGSKRTHFRRGHIRRLSGKSVWVRSAIVGANNLGTVDKEYHIKK